MSLPHAITRARERYNLTLTPDDFDRIRELILSGHPTTLPLATSYRRAILVAVRFRRTHGRRVWVATLWRDDEIVTVLPRESLWRYERKIARRDRELMRRERAESWVDVVQLEGARG